MKVRKVIYSDTLGVFLGRGMGRNYWSRVEPINQPAAPTFLDEADVAAYFGQTSEPEKLPDGWRLVEVWPDKPNNMASPEACANAGLPIWNPVDCCDK